jgi:solute carrier family 35 protein F1/2
MQLRATTHFLYGQVVAIFSLTALVMAKRLVLREVYTPSLLNALFYSFLAIVYSLVGWLTPTQSPRLNSAADVTVSADYRSQVRWWFYPLLALVDTQANICVVKSLEYISFATTGLMLNIAVPFVFALCVCAFHLPYQWKHCAGCLFMVAGGFVVLVGCVHREEEHPLGLQGEVYGWSLAVLAAALYALSTVLNQWGTKTRNIDDSIDCLSKVGVWGTLLCLLQVALFERSQVSALNWTNQVVMLYVGYVLCMFALYTAAFVLVQSTETTAYNLSLLCTSVYLMVMARQSLEETLDLYTWAAMLVMLVGLSLYTWARATATARDGATSELPQVSFKSMRTPRDEDQIVLNKIRLAEV